MNVKLEAAAGLEHAATLIQRHGHTKQVLHNDRGNFCAMGAINQAMVGHWSYPAVMMMIASHPYSHKGSIPVAYSEAVDALAKSVSDPADKVSKSNPGRVAHWNNAPTRTAEEVMARLLTVAALLRAAETIEEVQYETQ